MTAIIVDDEEGARKTLVAMLKRFCPEVQIIGEASTVKQARRLIKEYQPKLLFLDIKMPYETGFDLLESVTEYSFHVIFTTAYNNYAIKAIKFSAIDYLLKPIEVKELQRAVKKAVNSKISLAQLEVLKSHQFNNENEKIVLPFKEGFKVVNCQEIVRLEGARNYTWIYFINGNRILVAKTLKEYEELLTDYGFLRIHQSHLINLKCVAEYIKGRGGKVKLIDNSIVEVARSKKQLLLSHFNL